MPPRIGLAADVPMSSLNMLGCSMKSRVPAPWPMRSIVIAGLAVYELTTAVRIAAPVGVVSSAFTTELASGTPLSSSAVPGVGTGMMPCAHFTVPLPAATGELVNDSTPSRSRPTAAPTMSAMLSRAPTSWK